MPTITIIDGGETLTITNNGPAPLITISEVPPLTVTQIPGVGLVGPTGATGSIGPSGHAQLALSIPGALYVSTGTMPFIFPRATTIDGVAVAVGEAPSGDDIIFDVLVNGTTIFTTVGNRPTIPDGALEGASVFVPDVTVFTAGDIVTVDVIQVGSSVAGSHAVLVIDGEGGGGSGLPPLWTTDDATSEITGTAVSPAVPLSLTASHEDSSALDLHPAPGGTFNATSLLQLYDDTGTKIGDLDADGNMYLYDTLNQTLVSLDRRGILELKFSNTTAPALLFVIRNAISSVFSVSKPGSGQSVLVVGVDPGDITLQVQAVSGQTADIVQFWDLNYDGNTRFDKDARFITRVHSAPADGEIAAGDCAMWFDQTDGAAKLMIKGKSANGTVVTGNVALS